MLAPKYCKRDPPYCHHESDMLIVMTGTGENFDMRGATDEEKRQHRIEYLRARSKSYQEELLAIHDELIELLCG